MTDWCDSVEDILKLWAEKSAAYRALHLRSYLRWNYITNAIYIPIIVGSSVSGMMSFGNTNGQNAILLSYTIGTINVLVGILTSVLKFLRCEEKCNAHRLSARGYGGYHRSIIMELSLKRDHREKGDEFCRMSKLEFDRLHDESLPISDSVIQWYKDTFGDDAVNLPELGIGNVNIKINRD